MATVKIIEINTQVVADNFESFKEQFEIVTDEEAIAQLISAKNRENLLSVSEFEANVKQIKEQQGTIDLLNNQNANLKKLYDAKAMESQQIVEHNQQLLNTNKEYVERCGMLQNQLDATIDKKRMSQLETQVQQLISQLQENGLTPNIL